MEKVQRVVLLARLRHSISYPCPVCRGHLNNHLATVQDVELQTSFDYYTYTQCVRCGVVFLLEPPKNKLKLIYPDTYYSNSQSEAVRPFIETFIWWFKEKLDSFLIKKLLCR